MPIERLRSLRVTWCLAILAGVLAAPSFAQFVVPRITLQVADWLPSWDAANGGGWGVVPAGTPPGQWVAFTGAARNLSVSPGSYDVYWVQRTGLPPLPIASNLQVGAAGANVAVATGIRLMAADWARLDGTAHWAASSGGQQGIVADSKGSAMMLPVGDYDIYWKAGEEAGFGWVTKVNIAPPFGAIGLQVEALPEGIRVVTPAPGGPADRSGVRTGDLITAVDGRTVVGLDAATALTTLRGPPATAARLTISRGGAPITVSVTRDPQPLVVTVTLDSGVRLRLPAGQSLPIDDQGGWWGAIAAGADVASSIPINRSRNAGQPLTLSPGTYDLYWQRSQNAAPVRLAQGVVVAAGRITEADASLR
jgi:hypothetical protein